MLSLIITALVLAAIQVATHKLTGRKFEAIKKDLAVMSANARAAAEHGEKTLDNSKLVLGLLAPAVAQLPKTRAKRTTSKGFGEPETPVEASGSDAGDGGLDGV